MEFGTIASGSSGNCLYIGDNQTHLLIDAGISKKRINEGLKSFGIEGGNIEGILITHEHTDHIAGLGVMARKYNIPIYGTEKTLIEIEKSKSLGVIPDKLFRIVYPGKKININDITVEPFSIPHDAKDPISYTFVKDNEKIGMVTDLGYYDDNIVNSLKDSNILYIEANHDINMLQVGPYPYYLKQRILGNRGHLCNEVAGRLICELINDKLKQIVLGHLSKENNYPDLALETVLLEIDFKSYKHKNNVFDVSVAPRSLASNLITI